MNISTGAQESLNIWLGLTTGQEEHKGQGDLKQYMDDCGGILAMNNVKVSSSFEDKHRGTRRSKNLLGANYVSTRESS